MAADLPMIQELLARKDYAGLEQRLSSFKTKDLSALLPALEPLQKLVIFKLLDAVRAMELFAALPFGEKYFLFCGFSLQSIAPVLEGLTPAQRRSFVQLPREDYERMFRQLLSESPAKAQ